MDAIRHRGQDHQLYMPREDETESWDRLDLLLSTIRAGSSSQDSRDLVATHVGSLFARIETAPEYGMWPIGLSVSSASAHWVESVVGHEIDRLMARMLDHETGCVDCLLVWLRHLVEARITLSQWAWARDASGLLPET